jgi:hypothetical protein
MKIVIDEESTLLDVEFHGGVGRCVAVLRGFKAGLRNKQMRHRDK